MEPSTEADRSSVRGTELAFARWLSEDLGGVDAADLSAHLRCLRDSRRDLLARRGETRPDRVVTELDAADVELLVAQAVRQAELDGFDRAGEVRATCALWARYVNFLLAAGWWTGDRAQLPDLATALCRPARGGLLGRGAHTVRTGLPVELAPLRRTGLVRDAEDVLRGRAAGTARMREVLVQLGFLRPGGGRGPRWASWDSPHDVDAAFARRRLVIAEVAHVVRRDPGTGYALALATSDVPAEVTRGGRLLAELVGAGRLAPLVAGGVLPAAPGRRIARGLQPAVHVGLTRLADDGVLDLDGPELARAG
ncbi:hypothetical protein [Kineococcus rhizosphaerae]|uniref:Uncharacterized protein n=1 Tax=Kineococcus rhizosphaerae TaxID=559628 RepID=A0A2T0QXV4_9ACTN|nr:hypothetical protein [Kineococcus rhizosphaerae]PRY10862.1 hypothetical protein CLV37_115126 [Kineococcus rhizosphaerae]